MDKLSFEYSYIVVTVNLPRKDDTYYCQYVLNIRAEEKVRKLCDNSKIVYGYNFDMGMTLRAFQIYFNLKATKTEVQSFLDFLIDELDNDIYYE